MKYLKLFLPALLALVLGAPFLEAQSLKGMSLNGATGLYSIPSGRIGWERSSNFAFDVGYHAIISEGRAAHIPQFAVSIFKWVEISGAFDIQPDPWLGNHGSNSDLLVGAKVQLPIQNTALAIGGNFQALNLGSDVHDDLAGQIYLAVTYAGQFFNMPAETTMVLGKTFGAHTEDFDIDFGMGFDLVLLPNILNNFVHTVVDFANFSYSAEAFGSDARGRGVLNAGLRVDLSQIPALSRFKFVIDVLMTDALDDSRGFSVGAVFGMPVL